MGLENNKIHYGNGSLNYHQCRSFQIQRLTLVINQEKKNVYLSGLVLNCLLKNGIVSSREKIIMQQNINLCPSRIFQNSSINLYRSVYERKGVYA